MSKRREYIYAKLGYMETDDMVVVQEGYEHEFPILPRRRTQLEREIIIKDEAVIGGDVFGLRILIGRKCKILGGVFGMDEVRIMDGTRIYGFAASMSLFECGNDVEVDEGVMGNKVMIGSACKIGKYVIGEESISIGQRCDLSDCTVVCLNGDVRIGAGTKVFDVIARGNIILGELVEVLEYNIWSVKGTITHDKTIIINGKPYRDLFKFTKLGGEEICSLLDEAFYYCLKIAGLREAERSARDEISTKNKHTC